MRIGHFLFETAMLKLKKVTHWLARLEGMSEELSLDLSLASERYLAR